MSSLATGRGGARRGAGRKPKPLISLVEAGTFSVTRHGRLLWTDDSLLEAAAERPEDEWLQRLAMIQRLARERGRGRHDVSWFARVVRELKEEQEEAKVSESHAIEVTDDWVDGERVIVATNLGRDTPLMTLRTASICPNCVTKSLRMILERYESDAKAAQP